MIAAPPSQHVSAGALALLVHGLLLLALIFGLSWTSLPHRPIQADLWSALPEQPPPPPPPATMEPATPPDPAPAPAPKVEAAATPAPSPAEIALEQEKLREREQRLREERERKTALEETLRRQAEETRARVEAAREERAREEQRARLERERADTELRDLRQRQIAEEIARMREEMEADAAREREVLARERDAQARAHAARQARVVEDFKLRIKEKILAYLRLPPNLKGNPEVEYRVDLLPNGEVLRVTLRRSSGQPAYDDEVERAILRSSPLPLPPDRDTARVFREGLILKFRPSENAGG